MSSNIKPACRDNPLVQDGVIDEIYRVIGFVGGGGTACVYKVRTADDPHPYALKLLQERYFRNALILSQFSSEGEKLRDLQHPHIVRFYDCVVRPDCAYLLMDYVEGFELTAFLRDYRERGQYLPLGEVTRILVQAARAITFLHSRDLIHRDIKAANMLVERGSGKLYLVDFGIAAEADAITFNAGTRAYMPPEQQENTGVPVTHKADIYAFGITAYEMLAGQRPFSADKGLKGAQSEQSLIIQHREAPVPSLEALRPDLPKGVDAIFNKVLAKSPEDRYEAAREFVAALHALFLPLLPADLHDIDEVAPFDLREIVGQYMDNEAATPLVTAPPPAPRPVGERLLRWVVGLVALVLVLAGGILIALGSNDDPAPAVVVVPTSSPTPLETDIPSTTTSIPSRVPTSAATPTSTPSATQTDIPEESALPIGVWSAADGLGLAGNTLEEALAIRFNPAKPLMRLNIERVTDFRLALQLGSVENITRYGVAYGIEDEQTYLLFLFEPADGRWRLEQLPAQTLLESGRIVTTQPENLSLQVVGMTLRVAIGDQLIQAVGLPPQTGGVGLWLETAAGTLPSVQQLSVSLIGAPQPTPTRAAVVTLEGLLLADLHRFQQALQLPQTTLDCRVFLEIFAALPRYGALAQPAVDVSRTLNTVCQTSTTPENHILRIDNATLGDANTWYSAIGDLIAELEGGNVP